MQRTWKSCLPLKPAGLAEGREVGERRTEPGRPILFHTEGIFVLLLAKKPMAVEHDWTQDSSNLQVEE